jgi:hypothetical protein
MFRFQVCVPALLLVLSGCGEGEPVHPVGRSGTLLKTCPNLRTFYKWQGKLYLKDANGYREVGHQNGDLCDQIASAQSQ